MLAYATKVLRRGKNGTRSQIPRIWSGATPSRSRARMSVGSLAEALLAQAIVLNDFGSPTFARASSAYDPFNRTTVTSNVRRRRPIRLFGASRPIVADFISPSRTNLCLRSQDMANAAWTKTDLASVTSGVANAPDGTATLDLITEGVAGTASLQQTLTITAGAVCAVSRCMKAGNTPWVRLNITNGADRVSAWFNLATGVIGTVNVAGTASGATGGMVEEPVGSGIYHCWVSGIVNVASTVVNFTTMTATADATTSGRVANGTYITGWAQFEQMAAGATSGTPSDYIATTTVSVTRAYDSLTVAYPLGQTGTLLGLLTPYLWNGDQDGVTIWELFRTDGSALTRMARNSATAMLVRTGDAGGNQGPAYTHGLAANALSHQAMTWDGTAVLGYANGALGGTDNTLTPPYVRDNTVVRIGASGAAAGAVLGHIAVLAWPWALTPTQHLALRAALPTAA